MLAHNPYWLSPQLVVEDKDCDPLLRAIDLQKFADRVLYDTEKLKAAYYAWVALNKPVPEEGFKVISSISMPWATMDKRPSSTQRDFDITSNLINEMAGEGPLCTVPPQG